jgi:hypothetical protein
MESALRHMGKRLHIPINPKDTFGQILKNIDPKINAMPEKTEVPSQCVLELILARSPA